MNKMSMIFGAISAVSAAFACCLGGGCLYCYISDERRRKQKMEHDIEAATIRKLFYDVNELKFHVLHQEKK